MDTISISGKKAGKNCYGKLKVFWKEKINEKTRVLLMHGVVWLAAGLYIAVSALIMVSLETKESTNMTGMGGMKVNTKSGMIAAIFIALIGIPFAILVLADIGTFLMDGLVQIVAWFYDRRKSLFSTKKDVEITPSEDEDPPDRTLMRRIIQLGFFVVFLSVTMALPLFSGVRHGTEKFFLSFLMVSSLGFGDIATCTDSCPVKSGLVLIYATLGIILMTMSIEAAAEVFTKLHHVGAKLKDVANMKIWVGGHKIKVGSMLHPISDKYGIPMDELGELAQMGAEGKSWSPPLNRPVEVSALKDIFGDEIENIPYGDDEEDDREIPLLKLNVL